MMDHRLQFTHVKQRPVCGAAKAMDVDRLNEVASAQGLPTQLPPSWVPGTPYPDRRAGTR